MAENQQVPVNMTIYDAVRAVPKEAQKQFNNGNFSGTDINPMWRIKKLTELFGPAGIGWYTEVLSERQEQLDENTTISVVDLNLYVKYGGEWSKPIYGTGGNSLKTKTSKGYVKTDDEGYKKAYTDALSVACKALGIGADIYYARDTSTKYAEFYTGGDSNFPVPESRTAPAPVKTPAPQNEVYPPDPPLPWEEKPAFAAQETQKPVTAVMQFTENPPEVAQDTLTAMVKYLLEKNGNTRPFQKEIVSIIKPIAGNANYKDYPDPGVRKAVYDALYKKYFA